VEHTITANGIRQGHTKGPALSQLHIGLAVGFALVACLTAFGGGVIVGMWYKASEQIAPLGAAGAAATPETPSPGRDAASQPQEPVTFYNTLTNSNVAYAPLTPPATSASGGTAEGTKAAAGAHPSKGTPGGGIARTAAGNESPKQAKATPAKAAAAASTMPSGNAKAAANKPLAPARQPQRAAVATAKATPAEDFSVQVGSFGSAEQAERLRTNLAQKGYPVRVQPAAVPEQGLRYRVRVGNFAERTTADHAAHHLTAQEQVPAIVAGKD
jgi:cell division protein FtsN